MNCLLKSKARRRNPKLQTERLPWQLMNLLQLSQIAPRGDLKSKKKKKMEKRKIDHAAEEQDQVPKHAKRF